MRKNKGRRGFQLDDVVIEIFSKGSEELYKVPPFEFSKMSLQEVERLHIDSVLKVSKTLEEAAQILGTTLSTLWRKRRQFDLTF